MVCTLSEPVGIAGSPDRNRHKYYQARHATNVAQGKGGSGGCIVALRETTFDHVPLVSVSAAGAFLQGSNSRLPNRRDANLQAFDLEYANLTSANSRQTNPTGAKLSGAVWQEY